MRDVIRSLSVESGRNLFQRAILHSGSALATWSIATDTLRYTKHLAARLNCSDFWDESSSVRFLQCLKLLPVDDLINVDAVGATAAPVGVDGGGGGYVDSSPYLGSPPRYLTAVGPTIDHRSVLPSVVRDLMTKYSESVFATTQLLLGVTRNEGVVYLTQRELEQGVAGDRMRRTVRTYVQNVFDYHRQSIFDVLLHQYSDWERPASTAGGGLGGGGRSDPTAARDALTELLGDGQTVAPMVELAQFHARIGGAVTYFYAFNQPPRLDAYPRWAGGVHGDDLAYVFGAPLTDGTDPFPATYTRSDRTLAETTMRYWTNFIRTGCVCSFPVWRGSY